MQLSGQKDPQNLWPNTQWNNVSPICAGLFFRAEGGNANIFGTIQQEQAQTLFVKSEADAPHWEVGVEHAITSTDVGHFIAGTIHRRDISSQGHFIAGHFIAGHFIAGYVHRYILFFADHFQRLPC